MRDHKPYRPPEPDIITAVFRVRRMARPPADVERALTDLEAGGRPGSVPLVVAGDIVCLFADDFFAVGVQNEQNCDNSAAPKFRVGHRVGAVLGAEIGFGMAL